MDMIGVWRTAVVGLVVFAIIFDSLIIAAILHDSGNPGSTQSGQVQTYPDANSSNIDYIDLMPANSLVELPLIQPN